MNENILLVTAEPNRLVQTLMMLNSSGTHSLEPVYLDNDEDSKEFQKSFDTLLNKLQADGFDIDKEDIGMKGLRMNVGRASEKVLFATIPYKDYSPAHIEYIIQENSVIAKRLYFLGGYKYLSIAAENAGPIFIVGNTPLLGNWKIDNALKLTFEPSKVAAYYIRIPVLQGQRFEFKFVKKKEGYPNTFEEGPNRVYEVQGEVEPIRVNGDEIKFPQI